MVDRNPERSVIVISQLKKTMIKVAGIGLFGFLAALPLTLTLGGDATAETPLVTLNEACAEETCVTSLTDLCCSMDNGCIWDMIEDFKPPLDDEVCPPEETGC